MKIFAIVCFTTLSINAFSRAKIVHTDHYPNGNVKVELIKLKRGVIQVNHYYENGKLMESGFSKKGLLQGKWVKYSENGAVISVAYFYNDMKIGSWNHYNPWTNHTYKVCYENGQAVRYQEFDYRGNLVASQDRLP